MDINQQISDDSEVSVSEIGVPAIGRSEGELDSIPIMVAVTLKFHVSKLHHGMVQLMKANVWQPLAAVHSQLFPVARISMPVRSIFERLKVGDFQRG